MTDRKPVAYIQAVVRFPVYAEDHHDDNNSWPWFVYEEPGITKNGELGVCRRQCDTISTEIISALEGET